MRRFLPLLALLAVSTGVLAIDTEEAFDDPAMNERYKALIHALRCMKCQNESIADSPVEVAADLRRQVREMMAAGQSDAEIKDFLSSRYGDFILYEPPLKPTTWPLWGGPIVLLLVGGVVFARIVRARSRQPLEEDGD